MMRCLLAALLALTAAPAIAHAASPLDPIYACAAIANDSERLKCFDAALAKLKATEQSGDVTIVDREGVRSLEKDSFGFHLPSIGALFARRAPNAAAPVSVNAQTIEEVAAKITRLGRSGADQQAVFTLDNGQVWRQIDTASTATVKAGEAVTIKRAAMGSFMLVRAVGGAGIRVRRLE
jgi:hypothetical protein